MILPSATFGALRFSLSDPEGGQVVRQTTKAEQAHGFLRAIDDVSRSFPVTTKPQQTQAVEPLTLMYVAGDSFEDDYLRKTNVLATETNILRISKLEERIKKLKSWTDVCLRLEGQQECAPIRSATPSLLPKYENSSSSDAALRQRIDDLYDRMADRNNDMGVDAVWFFEQGREHARHNSYIMRTEIRFGAPLLGYSNWDDRQSEQKAKIKAFLREVEPLLLDTLAEWKASHGDELSLLYYNQMLFSDETGRTILADLLLAVGSLIFILIVMTLHTGSLFLGCAGLFQVLMSFPVTLGIYSAIFRVKLFSLLQVAGVFIILGIGADDVFILTDAVKQLRKSTSSISQRELFSRAFSSAFRTMLTTSTTTALAFGMTMVIKIPTVRYMGLFACIMVTVNFGMVSSLYLAALIIWDKHFRQMSCFKRKRRGSGTEVEIRSAVSATSKSKSHAYNADEQDTMDDLSLSRLLDPCCSNIVAPKIVQHPKTIITLFSVMSVVFLIFATMFKESGSDVGANRELEPVNPYWPREHKVSRRSNLNVYALRNASDNAGIEVRMVFGIKTIDRSNTDPTDDDDLGIPVYQPGFDITSLSAQKYIIDICDKTEANAALLEIAKDSKTGATSFKCFMTNFRDWSLSRNKSFPRPPRYFISEYREFLRRNASEGVRDQVGLHLKNDVFTIKFVNLWASTIVPLVSYRKDVQDLEAKWMTFMRDLPKAPSSVSAGFIVSPSFLFAEVYEQAVSVAWTAVGVSTAITFIVLLCFTQNIIITLLATMTIGLIVLWVCGLMGMYGWDLDPYIATCITILVGFSVDYVVHISISYNESQRPSRTAKVQDAICSMGVSVTAGFLSTAGAASFLLFATIVFFGTFGTFILSAICSAYLFAVLFFPAVLSLFGPENNTTGSILFCYTNPCHESPLSKSVRKINESQYRKTSFRGLLVFVLFSVAFLLLICLMYALQPSTTGDEKRASYAPLSDKGIHMPNATSLEDGWHELVPGGRTSCSRGAPWAFYFKKGSPKKVIVEFMGGGACWNTLTCGLRTSTFSDSIEGSRAIFHESRHVQMKKAKPGDINAAWNAGINDKNDPDFSTWSHIYLPYCTGDLHWGDSDIVYQPGLEIRHRGGENARVAVNWLVKNFPTPDKIFVTGCSAGSYASILWSAKIAQRYANSPSTRIIQFGDSGAGIVTESFLQESFVNWKAAKNFPWDIFPEHMQGDRTDKDLVNYTLAHFYRYSASTFPSHTFSQFNTLYDNNAAYFWLSMKYPHVNAPRDPALVDKQLWGEAYKKLWRLSNISKSLKMLPNYREWTGWGDNHCVIPYQRYWWQDNNVSTSDGYSRITLSSWVSSMIAGTAQNYSRIVDCSTGGGSCEYGLEQE